jgi:outer membrane receptor protein involved in Fe transport
MDFKPEQGAHHNAAGGPAVTTTTWGSGDDPRPAGPTAIGNDARSGLQTARMPRASVVLLIIFLASAGTASSDSTPAQDSPDLTGMSLDELLEAEVVYAAARRTQTLREAPSAVSIVTAAEIRNHGYRTLADVLRSLPSFYVTDDRNYTYVGVRGFDRPGDYSTRILLLLNGLRTNDNIYEQAYVGEEFLIDLDLIERIEVVRGPSAAVYGNNAFFAVVNVVTRRGHDFQGGEVSAGASSFGTRGVRASYGRQLDSGLDVLASLSLSDSSGQRLYFPEFDAPETRNGIADGIDGEHFESALLNLSKGAFSFEASHVSRDKGVPTASFGTVFGDGRTRTTDAKDLLSLTWARSLPGRSSLTARAHYGFYDYHGTYVFGEPVILNRDSARGQWYGFEASAVRSVSARHLVSAGLEFQDNFSQRQLNFDVEPRIVYQDARNESEQLALFAQDEITLSSHLTLHVGLRHDWDEGFGDKTSPRLGVIYDDAKATTLKLLYGQAFRAPNDFELHYMGTNYKTNPDLGAETIHTTELVVERTLRDGLRLNSSVYFNAIDDLISLGRDPADGQLVFDNAGRTHSLGGEIGLDLKRNQGPSGRLSYAWQRSQYPTGESLTNSPRHIAKAAISWPFFASRLTASIDGWYMSARRTLAGVQLDSSMVANLTLVAPRIRGRFALSASIYNLFDERYADPGSEEHRQDSILQDGRNFRLKLAYRF